MKLALLIMSWVLLLFSSIALVGLVFTAGSSGLAILFTLFIMVQNTTTIVFATSSGK